MQFKDRGLIDPLIGICEERIQTALDFYRSGEADSHRTDVPLEVADAHVDIVFASHCRALGISSEVAVRALQRTVQTEGYL